MPHSVFQGICQADRLADVWPQGAPLCRPGRRPCNVGRKVPGRVSWGRMGWDPEQGGRGRQASARFPKSAVLEQARAFDWPRSGYKCKF